MHKVLSISKHSFVVSHFLPQTLYLMNAWLIEHASNVHTCVQVLCIKTYSLRITPRRKVVLCQVWSTILMRFTMSISKTKLSLTLHIILISQIRNAFVFNIFTTKLSGSPDLAFGSYLKIENIKQFHTTAHIF